jgi:Golgi apparatus protein 1
VLGGDVGAGWGLVEVSRHAHCGCSQPFIEPRLAARPPPPLCPQDFRLDLALAEACRADVDAHCAKAPPGEGALAECLRAAGPKLSAPCRAGLARAEEREADDARLDAGLLQKCRDERSVFCSDVQAGGGRVFKCFAENMASADFGSGCQGAIMGKLRRREGNWRLDPPLRRACKADVEK